MKNLLLFSTLFLIAGGAFAQLTVKPNGTTESYIYVKDEILFVEQDIALTKNNTSTTEPSIYLRDNGQLIQGNSNSDNSGTGSISVQQNSPDTNARAYYYWCSPIGNPGDGLTAGNKNFGIKSLYDSSGIRSADQVQRTTDLDGLASNPITISTRWLYTYLGTGTEKEGKYQAMNANDLAPPAKGFTMKGVGPIQSPKLDQIYEFRGRPNNGDFTIEVAGPVSNEPQMTLSGNPYPSALDLNKLFYDTDNKALSTFWYYDEDRDVFSHYYSTKPFGYACWIPANDDDGAFVKAQFYIWNAGGGQSGPTGSGRENGPKRYAPIGQGIMFVGGGDNNATGTVIIKNSHRVFERESNKSIFFRPTTETTLAIEATTNNDPNSDINISTAKQNSDARTPQLRLYVVFDSALTRDMLLLFSDQATDGYDRGMDGLSPGGMKTDAFFPIGDDNARYPYVIQGTNYNIDKQIPITFKLHKPTNVNIYTVEEINKPYQRAYLFDKLENTYRDLQREQIVSTLNLPAGTYEDRFYIVFRNPDIKRDTPEAELLVEEFVKKNVKFFQNNPARQLEVRNPEAFVLKSAEIYDMAGKLVISEQNLGADSNYSFYTGNLSDGIYLVRLITSENIILDYKAVVHN